MDFELKIEYVNPKELRPYERNARKHEEEDIEGIKASIRRFGFRDPIGVWGKKKTIVEGHGRQIAALELGLDKVPIIRLDDMTDEERRAYALAHNKTAELSSWNDILLKTEILDIETIDMSEFGFSLPEIEEDEDDEPTHDDGYYGDERERTYSGYNLKDYDPKRVAGRFDLPVLKRCSFVPRELIGFNYVLSTKDHSKGVHFFIDDYQFERIWNDPVTYLAKLTEFPCICTPDFSLYTDMPLAMKIWNVYRSRLIGQMAADYGIEVIPTLQWADGSTLDWVFEGIEKGGTVATSTVGVMRDKEALRLWRNGMDRALLEVEPKTIVLYGTDVDFDFPCDVVRIHSREFVE